MSGKLAELSQKAEAKADRFQELLAEIVSLRKSLESLPVEMRRAGAQLQASQAATADWLNTEIQSFQAGMTALPDAIAARIGPALESVQGVASIKNIVQEALARFDQVTATQRATLDELASEIAARSTAQIGEGLSHLKGLDGATRGINTATEHLTEAAEMARAGTGWMNRFLTALIASVLAVMLLTGVMKWAGMLDSNRQARPVAESRGPSYEKEMAELTKWRKMAEEAPPKTREWMTNWWQTRGQ